MQSSFFVYSSFIVFPWFCVLFLLRISCFKIVQWNFISAIQRFVSVQVNKSYTRKWKQSTESQWQQISMHFLGSFNSWNAFIFLWILFMNVGNSCFWCHPSLNPRSWGRHTFAPNLKYQKKFYKMNAKNEFLCTFWGVFILEMHLHCFWWSMIFFVSSEVERYLPLFSAVRKIWIKRNIL